MGENQVHPSLGTVAFGSGLHGWAFTVTFFARVLAEKFKVESSILMKKLWGDNFYDAGAKKWVSSDTGEDGKSLKRGFAQFIMYQIIRLSRNIMDNNKDAVWKMLKALNVEIKEADKEKVGKDLLKHIYQRWLNAADALLEMICLHLPSPRKA
jgi:elongation factor 2